MDKSNKNPELETYTILNPDFQHAENAVTAEQDPDFPTKNDEIQQK